MSRELKIQAAQAAYGFVKSGMRLGIGTGSTADEFIRILAQNVASGLQIIGVPTSERSRALCEELGVPLTTLDDTPELDLTIDGADELDHQFRLIKGGGGALLREKIVASASAQMVVIADESKLVKHLGAFPLPIEVNPFGLRATQIAIEKLLVRLGLNGTSNLRMSDKTGDKEPYLTDGGHYIVDASLGKIDDPDGLAFELLNIPGVVQHGLFIGLADAAVIAGEAGVKILRPN